MTRQRDPSVGFPGTRQSGRDLLEAFRPCMGRRYAANRNVDAGPGHDRSVSRLSPDIRRRLVTEPEVVATALDAHRPAGAETFIQEVIRRGYSKVWLEHRPSVWADDRTGLARDLACPDQEAGLPARVARVRQVVTPCTPQGPLLDWIRPQLPLRDSHGISFCELRRAWDRAIWPDATAGNLKVKTRIPDILRPLEVA